MRTSKLIAYYFLFWILYLPLNIVISLLFKFDLGIFFMTLGIGALLLLAFLTIKLLIVKKKAHSKISSKENASCSETLMPKVEDNLESFRELFKEQEVKNE
ncbi:hypothetical protein J4476_05580 [Candidatus Woesearchaeota archaeon]|nr:hypothetical protein [Candidatus Woesearchaeota archaeon]